MLPLVFKNVIWTISSLLNAASSICLGATRTDSLGTSMTMPLRPGYGFLFLVKKKKGEGGLKSPFGGFPGGQW